MGLQFIFPLTASRHEGSTSHFTPIMDSTEKDILGLVLGVGWFLASGNDVLSVSARLEFWSAWLVSVGAGWRQGGGQRAACGGGTKGNNVRGKPARRRSRSIVACSSGRCKSNVGGRAVSSSRSANARLFLILSVKNGGNSVPVGVGKRPSLWR
jgi:hypothetical protein